MAKTVLTGLIEQLDAAVYNISIKDYAKGVKGCARILASNIEEEKQQIMDAWIAGREFGCKHDDPKTAEEYYQKTYNS